MRNFLFGQNASSEVAPPVLEGDWMNDANQAFSYLSNHESEKESWWRSMSMTLTLLKQAQHMIAASKEHIEAQEERIKELEKLATTDALTNLNNRRGFIDAFERELDRVQRGKSQGGLLMMIDLDNFKAINDIHGHQAGDAALKLVAKTLKEKVRTMDVVSRHGGDEFAVLLVNTDRTKILSRTQNMIKALNELSFEYNETVIPVRASIGLKEFSEHTNPESILDAADQSMYANKQQLKKKVLVKQDNKKQK